MKTEFRAVARSWKTRLLNVILRFTSLETRGVFFSRGSRVRAGLTHVGSGTRFNGRVIIKGQGSCEIGRYCAFGEEVRIITSNHSYDLITSQLALLKMLGVTNQRAINDKNDVQVGNDVWVGDDAKLLPGARIGDGAIIGAGAVVSGEIPCYAIAVGVPARVIKNRFSDDVSAKLIASAWWQHGACELSALSFDFNQRIDANSINLLVDELARLNADE